MPPEAASADIPIVAILRGVLPDQVVGVANVLLEVGIRTIEVPLNSPDPFASIAALARALPADCLAGAGTVLDPGDVRRTHEAGGRLVVSPNFDSGVVAAALALDMRVMPGILTPTEAFAAVRAGARQLKLFPAAALGPAHLRALRTVLPPEVEVFPVGGVAAGHIPEWRMAGAAGFGFGSEIFRPEYSLAQIRERALRIVEVLRDQKRYHKIGEGAP